VEAFKQEYAKMTIYRLCNDSANFKYLLKFVQYSLFPLTY
jgi:hypothetical protein